MPLPLAAPAAHSDHKLLIGIMTCLDHYDRVEAIEETWVPELVEATNVLFTYVRSIRPERENAWNPHPSRTFWLDHDEAWNGLRVKFRKWLRAALLLSDDWDYVMKVDDDVILYPDRLLESSPYLGHHYTGRPCDDAICGKFAAGGPGFFLSRPAAEYLAHDADWEAVPHDHTGGHDEDRAVGRLMRTAGVPLNAEWRLCHKRVVEPANGKNIISFHHALPAQLRKGWRHYMRYREEQET